MMMPDDVPDPITFEARWMLLDALGIPAAHTEHTVLVGPCAFHLLTEEVVLGVAHLTRQQAGWRSEVVTEQP